VRTENLFVLHSALTLCDNIFTVYIHDNPIYDMILDIGVMHVSAASVVQR